jgi:Zn-ribbon RNA-binding protein
MTTLDTRCTSSGVALGGRGTTTFLCPDCGIATIGRCVRCRDQSVLYTCPKCGFQGP